MDLPVTDRKPAEMSFTSWIEQQIAEAAERGAFDNLPGAGKPLPNRGDEDAGQAWLRAYVRREGVPAEELLPTPLRLRKEAERLAASAPALGSELEVREAVAELNRRILNWRRIPLGPPIFVPLVDEESVLRSWRDNQRAERDDSEPGAGTGDSGPGPARGRWRRRRGRRRPA